MSLINIIITGVGGQGILLAERVIAAAAMQAGLDVRTNEVHGMAQRGGSVVAHVRLGDCVPGPLVPEGDAHLLMAFEQAEALRQAHHLRADGVAVVASTTILPVSVSSGQATMPDDIPHRLRRAFPRLVYLDAREIARRAGSERTANMVLTGALANHLPLTDAHWRGAMETIIPAEHRETNWSAFQAGKDCRIDA